MEPTSARKQAADLIPPKRQLKAALHKSAERAQRLADAFGQPVPTAASAPRKAATKVRTKR